jgi:hypothetical protein
MSIVLEKHRKQGEALPWCHSALDYHKKLKQQQNQARSPQINILTEWKRLIMRLPICYKKIVRRNGVFHFLFK